MKFLRGEVKGAERLSYVNESFTEPVKDRAGKDKRDAHQKTLPTAAGLFSEQKTECIFVTSRMTARFAVMHSQCHTA